MVMKKKAIPRPDTAEEAREAIRIYNERGGVTPLEIAMETCSKRSIMEFTSKQVMSAVDSAEKRIVKALYIAGSKGKLTASPPNYDTCRNNNGLLEILQQNGFERDTPLRVEFQASKDDGSFDRIVVSRL